MNLVANLPCFRLSVEAPGGSYQRRPERLTKRLRTGGAPSDTISTCGRNTTNRGSGFHLSGPIRMRLVSVAGADFRHTCFREVRAHRLMVLACPSSQ